MTSSDPDQAYLQPYRDAHGQYGSGFDVTLWGNERSQRLRFEIFTQMIFMTGKRLLDAGSSRGDLAAYLLERDIAYLSYVGVDGLDEVVRFANQRGLERARFVAGDLVNEASLLAIEDPQIVLISGTLNTMDYDMAVGVLQAAWDASGEALIFNFLSDAAGPLAVPQKYPAKRLPMLRLLDWAAKQAGGNVQLRQDYFPHGHDATILMRRS